MTWCNFPMNGNYHEPSIDWFLHQLKKVLENDKRQDKEIKALFSKLQWVIEHMSEQTECGFLTFEQFGAIGDGVTDDSDAIKDCIEKANKTGMSIRCVPNQSYKVSAISQVVDCNIDFNGSSLIMPESGIVFTTKRGTDMLINSDIIKRGALEGIVLTNKSFTVTTTMSQGKRYNSSSENELYYMQHMCTDEDGNFINTPWYQDVVSGQTWTLTNVMDLQPSITIENVKIVMDDTSNTISRFLDCFRNNVHLKNIIVVNPINVTSGGYLIGLNHCSNCSVSNVRGCNLNLSSSVYGYFLQTFCASDIVVEDVQLSGKGWGWNANTAVSNMAFRHCNVNRIDVHYNWYGYFVADDCFISGLQSVINIGGMGYGLFKVSNCAIEKDSLFTSAFINFRNDAPAIFDGEVLIENCVFNYNGSESDNAVGLLFSAAFTDKKDFSVGNLTITLKGCEFNNVVTGAQFSYDQTFLDYVNLNYVDVIMDFKARTAIFGLICTAGRHLKSFYANKYKMFYEGTPTQTFSNVGLDTTIENSEIAIKYANSLDTSETLKIINSVLNDFGALNPTKNLIVHGCMLKRDASFSSSTPNQSVNGNIIDAKTKNNLASWNNVSK